MTQAQETGAVFASKREMEAHYRTNRNRVDQWTLRPDFPGGRQGPWREQEVTAYLQAMRSTVVGAGPQGTSAAQQKQAAEVQKIRADVQLRRLRLQKQRGSLVDRDTVDRQISQLLIRLRDRLTAIPEELCMELPAEIRVQAKVRWEQSIRGIIREMSNWNLVA